MRHDDRMTAMVIFIQPTSNATDKVRDGFTAMGYSVRIRQPRADTLRVGRVKFIELPTASFSVIAVTQLLDSDGRQTQCLCCLLSTTFRRSENVLCTGCLPPQCRDLRNFLFFERFVERKCGSTLRFRCCMADKCESPCQLVLISVALAGHDHLDTDDTGT